MGCVWGALWICCCDWMAHVWCLFGVVLVIVWDHAEFVYVLFGDCVVIIWAFVVVNVGYVWWLCGYCVVSIP